MVHFVLSIDSLGGLSLLGSRRTICIFPEFWVVLVVIFFICTFGKCISLGNRIQVVGRLVWWLAWLGIGSIRLVTRFSWLVVDRSFAFGEHLV